MSIRITNGKFNVTSFTSIVPNVLPWPFLTSQHPQSDMISTAVGQSCGADEACSCLNSASFCLPSAELFVGSTLCMQRYWYIALTSICNLCLLACTVIVFTEANFRVVLLKCL